MQWIVTQNLIYVSLCKCMDSGLPYHLPNFKSLLATVDKGWQGMWHRTSHYLRHVYLLQGGPSKDSKETIHLNDGLVAKLSRG